MIDMADRMLLAEARHALAVPFRDPVRVSGVLVPHRLARSIERAPSRLDVMARRRSDAPTPGASVPSFHDHGG